jgi:cytochrome c
MAAAATAADPREGVHGVPAMNASGLPPSSGCFRYSAGMRQLGEGGQVWNDDTLHAWLRNPKAVGPNTTMSFPGLRDEGRINDVIAYPRSQSG